MTDRRRRELRPDLLEHGLGVRLARVVAIGQTCFVDADAGMFGSFRDGHPVVACEAVSPKLDGAVHLFGLHAYMRAPHDQHLGGVASSLS